MGYDKKKKIADQDKSFESDSVGRVWISIRNHGVRVGLVCIMKWDLK